MFAIGVTGNIGSGKSTVCRILAKLGAVVIDADKLGHEAYRPHSPTWREIITVFGTGIAKADYEIDREKLGRIVFSNPDALAQLNQIVHPEVYRLAQEKVEIYRRQGVEAVVIEATLLIEAGWASTSPDGGMGGRGSPIISTSPDKGMGGRGHPLPSPLVNKIWLVMAPEKVVVRRLTRDKGMSEPQILARLRSQMPAEEKTKYADEVIHNEGSLARLESEVSRLWRKYSVS